jgi:hypothetical protein
MPRLFFECADAVSGCTPVKKIFAPASNTAFLYLAASHDEEAAQRFFDVYSRRAEESSAHPANVLREQVMSNRKLIDNEKFFGLAFTAFSCALRGENRKLLRTCERLQLPTGSKKALDSLLEILSIK